MKLSCAVDRKPTLLSEPLKVSIFQVPRAPKSRFVSETKAPLRVLPFSSSTFELDGEMEL